MSRRKAKTQRHPRAGELPVGKEDISDASVAFEKERRCRARTFSRGAGIFALALVVRLVYLMESSNNPTFDTPITDSSSYLSLAHSLVYGGESLDPLFWQPVFYPLFLAGIQLVTNEVIWTAKVFQILLGACTCVLTYLLGRRICDLRTGTVAGIITALYGPLIFYEAELLATGWEAFWCVALLLLFPRATERLSVRGGILCGVCGALSVLTRPNFLPFLVAGCVWLLFSRRRRGAERSETIAGLLAACVGFVIVAAPAGLWCRQLTGRLSILPATGGINMYIGNNPNSNETVNLRPGRDWYALATWPRREGVTGGMWAEDDFFRERVQAYVMNEPWDFLLGLADKSAQMCSARELPRTLDVYVFREWSELLGLLAWRVGGFGFPFGLLLPLAMVGAIRRGRHMPAMVWLLPALYALSIVVVFVSGRYRAPLTPVLTIPAAAGALVLIAEARARRWWRVSIDAGLMAAVAVAISVSGPFPMEKVDYAAEVHFFVGNQLLDQGRAKEATSQFGLALVRQPDNPDVHARFAEASLALGQVQDAIEHYLAALRVTPESAVCWGCLGHAYFQAGELDRAIGAYRKAVELAPEYAEAHSNLGVVLQHQGQVNEAIDHYRLAARLTPNDANVCHNLGMALADAGDLPGAEAQLRLALAKEPANADFHYALGTILERQGGRDDAARAFERALRLDSGHAAARAKLESLRNGGESP
jgi:tetratricopeptide (TPR) repeat protein